MLDVGPVRLGARQSKHESLPGTHLIFSIAFGGSGWAGGCARRGAALLRWTLLRCLFPPFPTAATRPSSLYPINGAVHPPRCLAQLRASRLELVGLRRKPVHDATLSAGAKVPLKRGKSTANGLAQKSGASVKLHTRGNRAVGSSWRIESEKENCSDS